MCAPEAGTTEAINLWKGATMNEWMLKSAAPGSKGHQSKDEIKKNKRKSTHRTTLPMHFCSFHSIVTHRLLMNAN